MKVPQSIFSKLMRFLTLILRLCTTRCKIFKDYNRGIVSCERGNGHRPKLKETAQQILLDIMAGSKRESSNLIPSFSHLRVSYCVQGFETSFAYGTRLFQRNAVYRIAKFALVPKLWTCEIQISSGRQFQIHLHQIQFRLDLLN